MKCFSLYRICVVLSVLALVSSHPHKYRQQPEYYRHSPDFYRDQWRSQLEPPQLRTHEDLRQYSSPENYIPYNSGIRENNYEPQQISYTPRAVIANDYSAKRVNPHKVKTLSVPLTGGAHQIIHLPANGDHKDMKVIHVSPNHDNTYDLSDIPDSVKEILARALASTRSKPKRFHSDNESSRHRSSQKPYAKPKQKNKPSSVLKLPITPTPTNQQHNNERAFSKETAKSSGHIKPKTTIKATNNDVKAIAAAVSSTTNTFDAVTKKQNKTKIRTPPVLKPYPAHVKRKPALVYPDPDDDDCKSLPIVPVPESKPTSAPVTKTTPAPVDKPTRVYSGKPSPAYDVKPRPAHNNNPTLAHADKPNHKDITSPAHVNKPTPAYGDKPTPHIVQHLSVLITRGGHQIIHLTPTRESIDHKVISPNQENTFVKSDITKTVKDILAKTPTETRSKSYEVHKENKSSKDVATSGASDNEPKPMVVIPGLSKVLTRPVDDAPTNQYHTHEKVLTKNETPGLSQVLNKPVNDAAILQHHTNEKVSYKNPAIFPVYKEVNAKATILNDTGLSQVLTKPVYDAPINQHHTNENIFSKKPAIFPVYKEANNKVTIINDNAKSTETDVSSSEQDSTDATEEQNNAYVSKPPFKPTQDFVEREQAFVYLDPNKEASDDHPVILIPIAKLLTPVFKTTPVLNDKPSPDPVIEVTPAPINHIPSDDDCDSLAVSPKASFVKPTPSYDNKPTPHIIRQLSVHLTKSGHQIIHLPATGDPEDTKVVHVGPNQENYYVRSAIPEFVDEDIVAQALAETRSKSKEAYEYNQSSEDVAITGASNKKQKPMIETRELSKVSTRPVNDAPINQHHTHEKVSPNKPAIYPVYHEANTIIPVTDHDAKATEAEVSSSAQDSSEEDQDSSEFTKSQADDKPYPAFIEQSPVYSVPNKDDTDYPSVKPVSVAKIPTIVVKTTPVFVDKPTPDPVVNSTPDLINYELTDDDCNTPAFTRKAFSVKPTPVHNDNPTSVYGDKPNIIRQHSHQINYLPATEDSEDAMIAHISQNHEVTYDSSAIAESFVEDPKNTKVNHVRPNNGNNNVKSNIPESGEDILPEALPETRSQPEEANKENQLSSDNKLKSKALGLSKKPTTSVSDVPTDQHHTNEKFSPKKSEITPVHNEAVATVVIDDVTETDVSLNVQKGSDVPEEEEDSANVSKPRAVVKHTQALVEREQAPVYPDLNRDYSDFRPAVPDLVAKIPTLVVESTPALFDKDTQDQVDTIVTVIDDDATLSETDVTSSAQDSSLVETVSEDSEITIITCDDLAKTSAVLDEGQHKTDDSLSETVVIPEDSEITIITSEDLANIDAVLDEDQYKTGDLSAKTIVTPEDPDITIISSEDIISKTAAYEPETLNSDNGNNYVKNNIPESVEEILPEALPETRSRTKEANKENQSSGDNKPNPKSKAFGLSKKPTTSVNDAPTDQHHTNEKFSSKKSEISPAYEEAVATVVIDDVTETDVSLNVQDGSDVPKEEEDSVNVSKPRAVVKHTQALVEREQAPVHPDLERDDSDFQPDLVAKIPTLVVESTPALFDKDTQDQVDTIITVRDDDATLSETDVSSSAQDSSDAPEEEKDNVNKPPASFVKPTLASINHEPTDDDREYFAVKPTASVLKPIPTHGVEPTQAPIECKLLHTTENEQDTAKSVKRLLISKECDSYTGTTSTSANEKKTTPAIVVKQSPKKDLTEEPEILTKILQSNNDVKKLIQGMKDSGNDAIHDSSAKPKHEKSYTVAKQVDDLKDIASQNNSDIKVSKIEKVSSEMAKPDESDTTTEHREIKTVDKKDESDIKNTDNTSNAVLDTDQTDQTDDSLAETVSEDSEITIIASDDLAKIAAILDEGQYKTDDSLSETVIIPEDSEITIITSEDLANIDAVLDEDRYKTGDLSAKTIVTPEDPDITIISSEDIIAKIAAYKPETPNSDIVDITKNEPINPITFVVSLIRNAIKGGDYVKDMLDRPNVQKFVKEFF